MTGDDVVQTVSDMLSACGGVECLKIAHLALEKFLDTVPQYERAEALDAILYSIRDALAAS